MRNRTRRALPLLLALSTGCPDGTGGTGGPAPVTSALPTTGKLPRPPRADPKPEENPKEPALDLGPFSKESLAELYRADVLGDEASRRAAQKKHGLIDDAGKPTPKVERYEAALQRFAQARPDEWSALVEEIERARGASAVPK